MRLAFRKALIGINHLIPYCIEGDDLVIARFFSQREDYANLVWRGVMRPKEQKRQTCYGLHAPRER